MSKESGRVESIKKTHFGEGSEKLICMGYKLATTKTPSADCDFTRGEEIVAVCGTQNIKVPLIVIDISNRRLGNFSLPRLALGSFMSYPEAIERLNGFFHEPISLDSQMRHVVFAEANRFAKFSRVQQKALLTLPTESALKQFNLREFYFPSVVHWVLEKGGAVGVTWLDFLNNHSLLTPEEYIAIKTLPNLPQDEKGVLELLGVI